MAQEKAQVWMQTAGSSLHHRTKTAGPGTKPDSTLMHAVRCQANWAPGVSPGAIFQHELGGGASVPELNAPGEDLVCTLLVVPGGQQYQGGELRVGKAGLTVVSALEARWETCLTIPAGTAVTVDPVVDGELVFYSVRIYSEPLGDLGYLPPPLPLVRHSN